MSRQVLLANLDFARLHDDRPPPGIASRRVQHPVYDGLFKL